MRAMILAAGRGERMRPLTDHTPKPLLEVAGKPLIFHQLDRLVAAGFRDLVINHGHLGDQIERAVGDGSRWGVRIRYSPEHPALETGGGIFRALPLLSPTPFLVINADVWTDFDLSGMRLDPGDLAHLVLVDTPPYRPAGDFSLLTGRVHETGKLRLTFSGIGVYRPDLFAGCSSGAFPLAPLLRSAMRQRRVSGEHYPGAWFDVGTPERLQSLDRMLKSA